MSGAVGMRIVNNSDPNPMIRFNIQLGNFTGPWGVVPCVVGFNYISIWALFYNLLF